MIYYRSKKYHSFSILHPILLLREALLLPWLKQSFFLYLPFLQKQKFIGFLEESNPFLSLADLRNLFFMRIGIFQGLIGIQIIRRSVIHHSSDEKWLYRGWCIEIRFILQAFGDKRVIFLTLFGYIQLLNKALKRGVLAIIATIEKLQIFLLILRKIIPSWRMTYRLDYITFARIISKSSSFLFLLLELDTTNIRVSIRVRLMISYWFICGLN